MSGRIVVFGREPLPGRVKTRLAREVGPAVAAAVYRELLHHTLDVAIASSWPVTLALADPPVGHWSAPDSVALEGQVGRDLGQRMAGAFARHFEAGSGEVILIGSDLASLSARHLTAAAEALRRAAVVLAPASDGGYGLLAQRAPGIDLFSEIPWSSPDTLDATRRRLASLGVAHVELETILDIDTADDLATALEDPKVELALRKRLRRAATRVSRGE